MVLGLCKHDPIVDTLRSVFHANIVSVPEERIRPLVVAAKVGNETASFRGLISPLLTTPTTYADPPIHESQMANISGTRTRQVDVKFGLQILGNFLQSFGGSPVGIDIAFAGALKVSFSFSKVIRYWIDDDELGADLVGSALNKKNPAAAIFFDENNKYHCYILDSSITTSGFTISVDKSSTSNFQINLPAIQQIIQNAHFQVAVSSASSTTISFTGTKQLGFAFSCVLATIDSSGRVISLAPGGEVPPLEAVRATGVHAIPRASHFLLTPTPVMLQAEYKGQYAP